MNGRNPQKRIIALAGNPNVGKSTLFNALTGLRQHTGNWPGKTVGMMRGTARVGQEQFTIVDLPGTYSLNGASEDEQVAAEFIAGSYADCTIVVCDGSALERNLILALQILERTEHVVLCVNLMDEAECRGIHVDAEKLSGVLGVPVVLTSAGRKRGLTVLMQTVIREMGRQCDVYPRWDDPVDTAARMAAQCVSRDSEPDGNWRLTLDRMLVSRRRGVPILLLLLFGIVWLTVWGANVPSSLLEKLFDWVHGHLSSWCAALPLWLSGLLVDGIYATSARVIAVMLPPMAIFFPLFTILEDVGYLPRMAFLLDGGMSLCGGCGKQALTLCMGLGCNAVGVTGCRIIDSPRERLAAILTNAMVPCNGRFPALILIGSLFFGSAVGALAVALCVVLGVVGAMVTTGILSKTVLRHEPSSFLMEMPPFRRPRIGQILVRSLLDRTLFVAGRAVMVAAPSGAVLWALTYFDLLETIAAFLNPLGLVMGLNGVILLGFLAAIPANELFVPVMLMVMAGSGTPGEILICAGWNWKTAVYTMVFTLFHWPCATTLLTVYRETHSAAKTAAAFFLPTAVGVLLCLLLNMILAV